MRNINAILKKINLYMSKDLVPKEIKWGKGMVTHDGK
jgi:hypothetical protein